MGANLTKHLANQHVQSILGTLFLALCAQIYIPYFFVPFTLQTFGVLVISLLPLKVALRSIAWYILLGSSSVPIFAGMQGGLAALLGARGGYIMGMFVATYIIGSCVNRFKVKSFYHFVLYSLFGLSVLFILGVAQLALFIGWTNAFLFGFVPFIVPECCKIVLAGLVAVSFKDI